jgi:hypothetical protein
MGKRIRYKAYLHQDKDSNIEMAEELGIDIVNTDFVHSLYEVEFDMGVDVETGESWIFRVNGVDLVRPVQHSI